MEEQSQRLFINNLPENITQTDLEKKFGQYGSVISAEVKERKNVKENQTPLFAYVQLNVADHNTLHTCITEISSKKWKGHWIEVQVAKESFMERLKREREEMKSNGNNTLNDSPVMLQPSTNSASFTIPTVNNKKYHSSSSEDSTDEEQEVDSLAAKVKTIIQNGNTKTNELDGLIIKNNKGANIKNVMKIKSVASKIEPIKSVQVKKLGIKESEADKKRLQSLAEMKKGYRQQKSLIKSALSNIDTKPKNKIVFGEDAEFETPSKKAKHKNTTNSETTSLRKSSQNKLALFEEEDDGNYQEHYNFEVKEQFEGRKGHKLMALQSRFKNDKRFSMDARFLEDHSDKELDNEEKDPVDENIEMTQEEEAQKQLEILEQVLGKKVTRKSAVDRSAPDSKKPKMMLRFDPSQPEHSKYEVKEPAQPERVKRKRNESERETEASTAEPIPEVSKDTFYKVTVDLKDTLKENEGFSLANMFSKEIENVVEEDPEEEEISSANATTIKQKKTLGHDANPFRYDSSSDEEEDEKNEKTTENPVETHSDKLNSLPVQKVKPMRLWTESFFFKDDDYRLQEGLDFIKRLGADDQGDFLTVRRNLKEIVRAKVRNNQRNNRPFKRKLGGKKRIRVKRAMKR